MNFFYPLGSNITVEKFGGKAFWLNWLYNNDILIPETFFLPVISKNDINSLIENEEFINELKQILREMTSSSGYAVRSSATNEDGLKESKAGNYLSLIFVKDIALVIDAIKKVIDSNKDKNTGMGIIIQKMIDSDISGLIFSSNPLTASKRETVISTVNGQGKELVSGKNAGINFNVEVDDNKIVIPDNKSGLPNDKIEELVNISKSIEKKLNYPIDIEWCYEKIHNRITIVQCRPITTIFIKNQIGKVTNQFMANIPNKLLNSDKIKLRLMAEQEGIKISDGYLVTCNCITEEFPFSNIEIERSPEYRGYSAVILFPTRISNKVIRSFIGDKKNVTNVTRCHRYGIRLLPDYDNLITCLQNYYNLIKNESWICSIIIQEIYDPIYTGIIKKSEDNYIIEFAKGHFVSKGVVPMSTYILDNKMEVIHKNEIMQYRHIGIIEGCTLEYGSSDDDDSKLVSLPNEELRNIIKTFKPIFDKRNVAIEFGILYNDNHYQPYLIDCVEDNKIDNVDLVSAQKGVLSDGQIEGKLEFLDLGDFEDSLNAHFFNEIDNVTNFDSEKIIFYAKLPSIKFLDILGKYEASNIGFVFEKGSLLCHLSVLLRERGIPAIIGISPFEIKEGEVYRLDTKANKKLVKIS